MSSSVIRKEALRVQRDWSPEERSARERAGRDRTIRLWKLIRSANNEASGPEPWAAGAMTADDLQRVAC
jgi:hypothetical protein